MEQTDTLITTLSNIEQNTQWNFLTDGTSLLAILSVAISIFSFAVAFLTYSSQRKTELAVKEKTSIDLLSDKPYIQILKDIIRHLYRNKVCCEAIRVKLEDIDYKGYPSEEHLLKLKVMPRDLHLEKFNNEEDKYRKLHELDLLLRNYNTEIDVAMEHLKSAGLDVPTKQRDMDTLGFKPGYLTDRIIKLMATLNIDRQMSGSQSEEKEFVDYYKTQARDIIVTEHNSKCNENKECKHPTLPLMEKERLDRYAALFAKPDDFVGILTEDTSIECGLNKKGSEKIHIILR